MMNLILNQRGKEEEYPKDQETRAMIINSEKQSRGTQAPYLRKVATPPSPRTTGILTSTSIQFYKQTILRQRRLNSKSKGPLRIELKKFLRCEFLRGASKSTRYKNRVLSYIPLLPIIALKIKVWERGEKVQLFVHLSAPLCITQKIIHPRTPLLTFRLSTAQLLARQEAVALRLPRARPGSHGKCSSLLWEMQLQETEVQALRGNLPNIIQSSPPPTKQNLGPRIKGYILVR